MLERYLGLWQEDGAERVNGLVSEKIMKAIKEPGKGWTMSEPVTCRGGRFCPRRSRTILPAL